MGVCGRSLWAPGPRSRESGMCAFGSRAHESAPPPAHPVPSPSISHLHHHHLQPRAIPVCITAAASCSAIHAATSTGTCMNSLTYLSRQFDVLAAARTPPSTPSVEHAQLLADDDKTPLKRVQTWSQKSFVQPSPSPSNSSGSASAAPWSLRRSYSSPAEVNPAEPSTSNAPSSSTQASPIPSGSRPPSRRPSLSSSEKAARLNRVESIFYRIFFVRVLIALWHYVLGLWRSVNAKLAPPNNQGSRSVVAQELNDEDEKDEGVQGKDEEKPPIQVHPATPTPPPLPLPMFNLPSLSRTNTDPGVVFADTKSPSPVAGSVPPVTSTRAGELPRTSTPPGSAVRKMPLHLPKTLVLDLDETLIHSTSRPMDYRASGGILSSLGFGRRNKGVGHTVEVVLGGRSTVYHVYKRPFVDYFLRKVRAHSRLHFGVRFEWTRRYADVFM